MNFCWFGCTCSLYRTGTNPWTCILRHISFMVVSISCQMQHWQANEHCLLIDEQAIAYWCTVPDFIKQLIALCIMYSKPTKCPLQLQYHLVWHMDNWILQLYHITEPFYVYLNALFLPLFNIADVLCAYLPFHFMLSMSYIVAHIASQQQPGVLFYSMVQQEHFLYWLHAILAVSGVTRIWDTWCRRPVHHPHDRLTSSLAVVKAMSRVVVVPQTRLCYNFW